MRNYRARRIDNNEWVYGYLFESWEQTYILWGTINGIPCMTEVHPSTVSQSTGKLDKNGDELFGGDKVRGTVDGEWYEWIVDWEETDEYTGWSIGNDNIPFEIIPEDKP